MDSPTSPSNTAVDPHAHRLDYSKGLLWQVHRLGVHYDEWVCAKHLFLFFDRSDLFPLLA